MQPTTAEQLMRRIEELDLVPPAALAEAYQDVGPDQEPAALGQALVRREEITGFQLEKLLRGDRVGFYFGKAKLLYQIGAGSFARVFRAINRDTGRILAVKVLRNRYSQDPDKCKSFQREGDMGRLLRHPNIVEIEEAGLANGTSYITMEFIEGQNLRELVRIRGAIDLAKGIDMMLQLTSALEYAHRRGVTHRDIKASNVLVSSTGVAKLVDFGLANVDATGDKALGRLEQPRTVDYAALEKFSGMQDDSVRSDIYFMGCVGYLVFSGKSALFETRDRNLRSDPRRFTDVVPLAQRDPSLPRDVVDVIARMMHLDPMERWQTIADVHRAFERLAERRAGGGGDEAAAAGKSGIQRAEAPAAEPRPAATHKGSLMLVESAVERQQTLRAFFSKLGYKVLLTENPRRALSRFSSVPAPANCLVLSAQSLGEDAVEAFNALSEDPFLAHLPAILLVGPRQAALVDEAKADSYRKVVTTPVKPQAMSDLLASLIPHPS